MSYPLVVIVGPTASGKSSLAMKIAKKYNGEIICADSRTVYRHMDIGTAKPSKKDRSEVRHHLLDVVEPSEPFTAANFQQLSKQAIDDIVSRGKLPILVGGTGLYVDSVVFDYKFGAKANEEQREVLNKLSVDELQKLCSRNNIELPVNSTNKRHLVRAIELGGLVKHTNTIREDTLIVGIKTTRDELRRRVVLRIGKMFREGVVEETSNLIKKFGRNTDALSGNIYNSLVDVILNHKSLHEAHDESVRRDMQLAKRQMTWFKRNPYIFWSDDTEELTAKVDQFLSKLNK